MKKIKYFALAFSVIAIFSFATTINEWKADTTTDGVEFSSKYVEKTFTTNNETHEYVLHKVTNNNNYNVEVSWQKNIWYNGVCRSCDLDPGSGYDFSITLKPGESIEGSIDEEGLMLKTYSKKIKPESASKLTKYEFASIVVKKMN